MTARAALEHAKREEEGNFYWRMSAGVFAAFTIEAYLNHLGQRQIRDWDAFERLGPREKLLLIQRILHFSVDQGRRPFQAFNEIFRLRNSLAHGKTVTVASDMTVNDPHDEQAQHPQPSWMKLCSLSSVTRMVEDAEAMIRDLHLQSGSKLDPFDMLGHGSSGISEVIGEEEFA